MTIPTITTFAWVPEFARGFVRDLRPRWAFEEVGQPYEVNLTRDAKTPEHRRHQPFGQVDMQRVIYGGFKVAIDSGDGGPFGYVDGMIASVAADKRRAFDDHAAFMATKLKGKGALRIVNGWGADVPEGKVTDFNRAVEATDGETVTFGWIEWPDKATYGTGWGELMADGSMQQNPPAWDGQRAIFAGFAPILDTDKQ